MIAKEELLALCERGVETAAKLGAEQVEVFGSVAREAQVELQKDDLHTAVTDEEVSLGVRIFRQKSLGFATVNGADRLDEACRDALAMASAAPPDPLNGLDDPRPVNPLDRDPDPGITALDVTQLVEQAVGLLRRVKGRDTRVRIDSGSVYASVCSRAIVTSTGVRLSDDHATAGGQLFGMAVDGDDVGSSAAEGISVLRGTELDAELESLAERFVERCCGALGARKGVSFRGTVILSPDVVAAFLLGSLLSVLSGKSVRTGTCPLVGKIGESIASSRLTMIDDPHLKDGAASEAFDREGTPTARTAIIDAGVLQTFLYDVYEARAAGHTPTGNARGGATDQPRIGPSNVLIEPGEAPYESLLAQPDRAILVNRFSGSANSVTGEFSGVVKCGFLLERGDRTPIRETMIAGNLYQMLRSISGISRERQNIMSCAWLPALRVEDISVTVG